MADPAVTTWDPHDRSEEIRCHRESAKGKVVYRMLFKENAGKSSKPQSNIVPPLEDLTQWLSDVNLFYCFWFLAQ